MLRVRSLRFSSLVEDDDDRFDARIISPARADVDKKAIKSEQIATEMILCFIALHPL